MFESRSNTATELGHTLVVEQIQALSRNQLVSIPMNIVLALSINATVRGDLDTTIPLSWIVALLIVNSLRFLMAYQGASENKLTTGPRNTLRLNGALMLVTGALWAVVPAIMLDLNNPSSTYVLFILAGLSAGATVQAGTYSAGAMAFVGPIFASLIFKLLSMGEQKDYFLALDTALYLGLLFLSSRRGEEALRRTVLLRIEATALAASLDREHTASKAAAARFFELANHDPLTGLANRSAFSSTVNAWRERALVAAGSFYLFFLDLDHFKSINDTLGHSAGDQVLKKAALLLGQTIDGDHFVARLGGDEFAILLSFQGNVASEDDAASQVAARIISKFSDSFQVGEQCVSIGVSVGIAKFPTDGATVEDLLAHADLALYAAKDGGRHGWRRFDVGLLVDATMARDIELDLAIALADKTLQIVYQPQITLVDHELVGLEALLRWSHPVHGWIPPSVTVAAAKRIRKSELLTEFVLDQACRQIQRLSAAGLGNVRVGINISPNELVHSALPALVQHAVAAHRIDPGQIELEITEEAFAASEAALATLNTLSGMGIRLAIDDFGTGCSSIAYLRSMRVDRIKIDRSFVTGLANRSGDRILVQAILGIGQSFGIEVLAEGVETAEDADILQSFGCKVVQGYYFGRPLPQEDIAGWIALHTQKRWAQDQSCVNDAEAA